MLAKFAGPLCAVIIAAGAVGHGLATHRWREVSTSAGRFEAMHAHAVKLGDYAAEEIPNDMPLKEKSVATTRRYVSEGKHQAAVVSIITGAPGSVATHTPDVCYPGSGYKTVKERTRETIDVPGYGPMTYYVAEFEKKTATATDRQRVRWAWSTGSGWSAPDAPRGSYFWVADLAKIYIVTAVPPGDLSEGDGPAAREFVAVALAQYAGLGGN